MIKRFPAIISVFFIGYFPAQIMWQFKKDTVLEWRYKGGDEFNGENVDTDFWKYSSSGSHSLFGNKEQQYYTNGNNHLVRNGVLHLVAKKDSAFEKTIDWMGDEDSLISNGKYFSLNKKWFPYTAGQIESIAKYQVGFFECRFRIPYQKGYWPAFWLHGGDPYEEIDMMECKTEREQSIHLDTHCGGCDRVSYFLQKRSYGGWIKTRRDFTKEFNVAACEWNENEVRFYLNGECTGVSKVKFNVEKHITLNIAVPSDDGPFKPGPDKNDTSKADFEIDYVRIWERKPTGSDTRPSMKKSIGVSETESAGALPKKSSSRTRNRLVYGEKTEHHNDGFFIYFLNDKEFVFLKVSGVLTGEAPTYKITDQAKKIVVSGALDRTLLNVDKKNLAKGRYEMVVKANDREVFGSFVVD